MTLEEKIKKVCEDLLPFYRHATLVDLLEVARKASKEAEETYKVLPKPRTCDLDTYIIRWISETILTDVQLNHGWFRDQEEKNKAITEAMDKHVLIHRYYAKYGVSTETVSKIWKDIDMRIATEPEAQLLEDYQQLFKDLEPAYIYDINALNERAERMGFESHIDLNLYFSRTQVADYRYFFDNVDRAIVYCQQHLPDIQLPKWFYSQFNSQYYHDFLSFLPKFPKISFPDGVIDLATQEYPILKKFKSKIKIEFVDGGASARYMTRSDTFWIGINQNDDHRHQVTSLIHELGHVIGDLENFKVGQDIMAKGRDRAEYLACRVEYYLLKKLSPMVFNAELANVLRSLTELLFEIVAYKNPNQDLAKLNAEVFNRCFPDAHQTKNFTYLIKYNMIFRPFRNLSYSIAFASILSELITESNRVSQLK